MKYYIHKQTGEPLALLDRAMVDIHTSERSKDFPHLGERSGVVNLCIFPERWHGNGIPFTAIDFRQLKAFKRIRKDLFFDRFPDFGQWRGKGDITFMSSNPLNIPVRKKTF